MKIELEVGTTLCGLLMIWTIIGLVLVACGVIA